VVISYGGESKLLAARDGAVQHPYLSFATTDVWVAGYCALSPLELDAGQCRWGPPHKWWSSDDALGPWQSAPGRSTIYISIIFCKCTLDDTSGICF